MCAVLDARVFLLFWRDVDVLIILFFFSYVLHLSMYSTEQMHISENSDMFTILSKSSTIPKDCNYVCYKFAAYFQPMHQSFMYLFYN